jgi:hypothetical protein
MHGRALAQRCGSLWYPAGGGEPISRREFMALLDAVAVWRLAARAAAGEAADDRLLGVGHALTWTYRVAFFVREREHHTVAIEYR